MNTVNGVNAGPKKRTTLWIFVILIPLLVVVAGAATMKWAGDSTWPTNRITRITGDLADRCPDALVTAVSLEKAQLGVQCDIGDERHMFYWHRGTVKDVVFRPIPGREPFALDDFNLAAAARAIDSGRAAKIELTATDTPGQPKIVLTDSTGRERQVDRDLR